MGKFLTVQKQLDTKSIEVLLQMAENIRNNSMSKNNNQDSIHIYNEKAEKRLNDISWAIYYKTQEKYTIYRG